MIQKALNFALVAHEGQFRKGTSIPYFFHPAEVAQILLENNCNEEVVCAGVLHDTVEDVKASFDMLEVMFNKKVVRLVAAQSEDKSLSWRERKHHTINYLKSEAYEEEKLVACADKLSNIRSMKKDFDRIGDELWKRFNAGYEDQRWYYTSLVDSLSSLDKYEMYKEFKSLVGYVFNLR